MNLYAVFNRDGGTFRTTDMDAYCAHALRSFEGAGHEIECHVVSGDKVVETMEKAAALNGVDGLIAGGGDGTISAASSIAWKSGIALGIVPAGTMNLFARSLKIPLDIWDAIDVLSHSDVRNVDIASANGRSFVHQFSAGLHARMVRYRNSMSYASRLGKIRASARAAIGVMLNPPEFEVEFNAEGKTGVRRVSAISVSNNEFGSDALMYADDVTRGHLGFYIADPLTPAGVAKLTLDILRGRLKDNEAVTAMTVTELELHFPRHRKDVRCVIDGELLPMDRDILLKIHAGELKVLVDHIPQKEVAEQQGSGI
ncbi:diacylglycerol/lipid kinase family protein [Aliirhizobium cellulosilyticum]|uniref:Diacylglycerol kinase family enzyme n=1 Tax=Aliirhizobium cellulosilyticum TaxID=393664 RepID=A0A7W6XAS3_9HYPH|nr:diacylglycerol kinase family protein [Rhizobium cellulosilyticum]MBB4348117.1 diacylglycerol kinase family enzyme [Rhizobium cellulosilyticum]MBB4411354.1 diacylglycerol kinase family enzyme [Rhizobium cellulosilyticum]MBB4446043.1 diacylglycerol kinase family enzyme [Rhizobium cellulosilyticum]